MSNAPDTGPPEDHVPIDLPPMPREAKLRIARFLVEELSRRALVELGLLPGDDPGTPW